MRTEIYINNTLVELLDDIPMPFTYAIADIKEPEKRNTNFSKTITIPGTSKNNKLFSHIWNINHSVNSSGTINFNPSFNPNYKSSVLVLVDGLEQFRGIAKLDRVNITDDYKVTYDLSFQGKLSNIFQVIDNRYMNQLDLSAYNHTYTAGNQQASWANYIYKNGTTYPYTLGEGYVYPMIDYGYNNNQTWDLKHFFPAVYEKTVITNLISQAGFQYQSNFIDGEFFKHLVIPYNGGSVLKLSQAEIESRTFLASSTGTTSISYFGNDGTAYKIDPIPFTDDSTPPNFDGGNNYNTSTSRFTVAKSGTYKVQFNVNLDITHNPGTSPHSFSSTFLRSIGWVIIDRLDSLGNPAGIIATGVVDVGRVAGAGNIFLQLPASVTTGQTTSSVAGILANTVALNQGDVIRCRWQPKQQVGADSTGSYHLNIYNEKTYFGAGSPTGYTDVNFKTSSSFTCSIADTNIQEGDTVDISGVLPAQVKQSDYFKSFLKDFNLYVTQDPVVENKLIIEPRNDFYSSGSIKIWTEKVDKLKPVTITPMGELNTRSYLYTYKRDEDYYNDTYQKKYNEVYGEKLYDISNDFLKEQIKIESIFSPTPLSDYAGNDRILSRIFILDQGGQVKPKPSNIRRLYYGGVKTTTNSWDHVASSGTTNYTTYPYAGHLDDPASPTIDINFGVPEEVFYTASYYTNNNLFNIYHRNMLEEISDKDSKLVTCYLKLDPIDIANLDFRDEFFLLNDYFRLNKIFDRDPISDETVKCEFVKLKLRSPFSSQVEDTNGGNDITFSATEEKTPIYTERTTNGNSYGQPSYGKNNYISPTAIGCFISGSNNYIGDNSKNCSILASSGTTILAGVENVTAIGTNNATITESNKVYVDGKTVSPTIKVITTDYDPTLNDTTIFANITAETDSNLPDISDTDGVEYEFKKIDNSGTDWNILAYSGQTIDGNIKTTLTSQYSGVVLRSYGGNWYIISNKN